jgi:serine/threonine protein phosphatase PrpC
VPVEKMLRRAVEISNMQVYRAAHEMNVGRMGTTLTAAYLFGDQLFLAHLGDSRAYLVRGSQISCLTNDHSLVGDLVRSRIITPDLVRSHEQRSVLTRAIGLELFVTPDITNHRLLAGDRLILCSDGIWSVLEDDEILGLASEHRQAKAFGNELILTAISRGSDDNCSAVVADIRFFQPLATPKSEPVQRKWFGVF